VLQIIGGFYAISRFSLIVIVCLLAEGIRGKKSRLAKRSSNNSVREGKTGRGMIGPVLLGEVATCGTKEVWLSFIAYTRRVVRGFRWRRISLDRGLRLKCSEETKNRPKS